jgi:hypothetical protein
MIRFLPSSPQRTVQEKGGDRDKPKKTDDVPVQPDLLVPDQRLGRLEILDEAPSEDDMVEPPFELPEHERTEGRLGAVVPTQLGLLDCTTAAILAWARVARDGGGSGVEGRGGVFAGGDGGEVGGKIPAFELEERR